VQAEVRVEDHRAFERERALPCPHRDRTLFVADQRVRAEEQRGGILHRLVDPGSQRLHDARDPIAVDLVARLSVAVYRDQRERRRHSRHELEIGDRDPFVLETIA
jgi:hypothetical protein